MQGHFNIEFEGKKYGVLVRPYKYGHSYKLAKSIFKKLDTATLGDELLEALKNEKSKTRFFGGEVLKL